MSYFVLYCLLLYMQGVADQIPRLGKKELICLLTFTCNNVVSVRKCFSSPWYLGWAALFEPRREKTGFLHMRKKRRRSASR